MTIGDLKCDKQQSWLKEGFWHLYLNECPSPILNGPPKTNKIRSKSYFIYDIWRAENEME